MRKYAFIENSVEIELGGGLLVKKVMLYKASKKDVYMFLYDNVEDGPCSADLWFETLQDAEEVCLEEYGIKAEDWIVINDPLPFCQHDIIAPVRVKGRETGTPEWGTLEKLADGEWITYKQAKPK